MTRYYAAGYGALIWLVIALVGGRMEAWDSPLYGLIGFPALIIGAGVLGWMQPKGAWRLGAWMIAGHAVMAFITGIIGGSSFNLWPLTLILFAVFSLPFIGIAALAGFIRRKVRPSS